MQNTARLTTPGQLGPIVSSEYDAQILKLRLPGQKNLKNAPERCSADPGMLETIGRSVGQQVRIKRKDDSRFVALYTVKQANPGADLRDHGRANVVRAGEAGRERLGTTGQIQAIVQARVIDTAPQPGESEAVRFFELANDDGKQSYFIAIAPHGGQIERHTDEQAVEAVRQVCAAGFPGSLWLCKGYGDGAKGASDRWHITSTDLQPACFPLLQSVMSRQFCYAVAFHGFHRQHDEADVYIGGAAMRSLKIAIKKALSDLDLPIKVKISTRHDSPKFQGFSVENITNRVAKRGIHLEQSAEARKYYREIACAVAQVCFSRLRFLICILERKRDDKKTELVQSFAEDLAIAPLRVDNAIQKYTTWKTSEDALAAMIYIADELQSFESETPATTRAEKKKG